MVGDVLFHGPVGEKEHPREYPRICPSMKVYAEVLLAPSPLSPRPRAWAPGFGPATRSAWPRGNMPMRTRGAAPWSPRQWPVSSAAGITRTAATAPGRCMRC